MPARAGRPSFYALHHMLAKGALFLGVGRRRRDSAGAAAAGARRGAGARALGLAGLPLTGGAWAKLAMKPGLGGEGLALLASLAAAGSTLLMLHFVSRLATYGAEGDASPSLRQTAPWLVVAAASVLVPVWLFPGMTGLSLTALADAKSLWGLLWPIALGAVAFLVLRRMAGPSAGDPGRRHRRARRGGRAGARARRAGLRGCGRDDPALAGRVRAGGRSRARLQRRVVAVRRRP